MTKFSKESKKSEQRVRSKIHDLVFLGTIASLAQEKLRRYGSVLGDTKKDLSVLIRLLKAWSKGIYKGVSVSSLVIVAGAVWYFLNPIDAIPDFIPALGFSDDLAVIGFALARLKGELEKFEEWEQTIDVKSLES